jgi:putative transposase
MDKIDEIYTKHPFKGARRIRIDLIDLGYNISRKKVQQLMQIMGLEAVYPKPNLSKPGKENKKYPYLLKDMDIIENNQVWSTDITYIKMKKGFTYLTAVIDWHSRFVLSWKLSNTLHTDFCIDALNDAFKLGTPLIFNTDQGSQYTSDEFTGVLTEKEIWISMDGKGRALDNIFVERLWRTVKYEEIYLNDYENMTELKKALTEYFLFYNYERKHQGLGYKTPAEVYYNGVAKKAA